MSIEIWSRVGMLLLGTALIEGACFWMLMVRHRNVKALIRGLDSEKAQTREDSAEALIDRGLDESAEPLLAFVEREENVHVRLAVALSIARRQWEPAYADGVAELREWAATTLERQGLPVTRFGPGKTRLSDMGGPRETEEHHESAHA